MSLGTAYDRLQQIHVQCLVGDDDDSRGVAAGRVSKRSQQACSDHVCAMPGREASERVLQSHVAICLPDCFFIAEVAN